MRITIPLLVGVSAQHTASASAAFVGTPIGADGRHRTLNDTPIGSWRVAITPRPPSSVRLFNSKGPGNVQRPKNEFSRQYRAEAILGPKRRDYKITVKATEDEREALAERFKLSNIANLEADLVLRRDYKGNKSDMIHAEGTLIATVTQTCVRTSEDFDVDLEFNFVSAMRAVGSTSENSLEGTDVAPVEASSPSHGGRRRRGKRQSKSIRLDTALDEMGMKEIEDLLTDFSVENNVIEDEAIFSSNGIVDVGELVAQTFCLKLDPYPKKPGSQPISLSFTA